MSESPQKQEQVNQWSNMYTYTGIGVAFFAILLLLWKWCFGSSIPHVPEIAALKDFPVAEWEKTYKAFKAATLNKPSFS